jgi:hypothetical protein
MRRVATTGAWAAAAKRDRDGLAGNPNRALRPLNVVVAQFLTYELNRTNGVLVGQMSGNPTYQELAAWSYDKFRVADHSKTPHQ